MNVVKMSVSFAPDLGHAIRTAGGFNRVGRSVTECHQCAVERIESSSTLSNVQRLGQIERREHDASFPEATYDRDLESCRAESDVTRIVTDETVTGNKASEVLRSKVAIDGAGLREAESGCRPRDGHDLTPYAKLSVNASWSPARPIAP